MSSDTNQDNCLDFPHHVNAEDNLYEDNNPEQDDNIPREEVAIDIDDENNEDNDSLIASFEEDIRIIKYDLEHICFRINIQYENILFDITTDNKTLLSTVFSLAYDEIEIFYFKTQKMFKTLDEWYDVVNNKIPNDLGIDINNLEINIYRLYSFLREVLEDPLRSMFERIIQDMNEFDADIKEICDHYGIEVSELSTLTPEMETIIVGNYTNSSSFETFKSLRYKFRGFAVGTYDHIYVLQSMKFRTIFPEKSEELYNKFCNEIPLNGEKLHRIYKKIEDRYFSQDG
jgi:hypothetical protein